MRFPAAGESAADLPWLWPDAHSLSALARPLSDELWPFLRRDPAALILVHRHGPKLSQPSIRPARFLRPQIADQVLAWHAADQGVWLDYRTPITLPIYQSALALAYHARLLAERTSRCDPESAWTAGLLAPLGWFAMTAADPSAVAACQSDSRAASDLREAQTSHWGMDHAAIARRLAHRWELPNWLRVVAGHLDLPCRAAEALGVDAVFFAVVQLAALMAEHAGYRLGLVESVEAEPLLDQLGIGVDDLRAVQDRFRNVELTEAFDTDWTDPRTRPELFDQLREAAEVRRSAAEPILESLQHDLDAVHHELERLRRNEEGRVRDGRLAAMAELAAGASHEINNPLAVISGQAQYLLNRTEDGGRRHALESIVRQTRRIHDILADLMQFARPPQMVKQRLDLAEIVENAVRTYRPLAAESGVNLDCNAPRGTLWVDADPRHLETAVGCLVRNAIEAAAPGRGWASVHLISLPDGVEVRVEDSGTGPTESQREHLFDPFWSGRSAGRGRGLGLSTAWRLAREHGGDVRHEPVSGGPTRFVLRLPSAERQAVERLSA